MLKSHRTFMSTVESVTRRSGSVLIPSMETIAFQKNDPFGPELESIFMKFKDLVDQGLKDKQIANNKALIEEVEDAILRRFGINIKLIVDESEAATIGTVIVAHNPMLYEWIRKLCDNFSADDVKEAFPEPTKEKIGNIDFENAKISGTLSDYEAPLWMNFNVLFGICKLSSAQVVAVCLHEIGHMFNALALSNRVNSTNQVMADLARYLKKDQKRPDVEYVYKEVKKLDPDASKDIAEALVSGNAVVMGTATFRLVLGTLKSLMFDSNYDRTANESLADVFATRFGYGEALVSGLELMIGPDGEYKYLKNEGRSAIGRILISIWLGITALMTLFAGAGMILPALVIGFFAALIGYNSIRGAAHDQQSMAYDDLRQRYVRIRLQMVEMIKSPSLDNKQKKIVLDQIVTLDKVIKSIKTYEGWASKMANFIFSAGAMSKAQQDEMYRLESMVANDLFVKGAQLQLA